VSQSFAYDLEQNPLFQQDRRVCMPEVMEANRAQGRSDDTTIEDLAEVVGWMQEPSGMSENQVCVGANVREHPLFRLSYLSCSEDGDRGWS
jgi:hypothetical protein